MIKIEMYSCLPTFITANTASKQHIAGHDRDPTRVEGAEVGIFEEMDQVSFGSFLESEDRGTLEAEVWAGVLGNFTNEALEREFLDQEVALGLVLADFAQRNGSWAVATAFFFLDRYHSPLVCCLHS